MNNSIRIRRLVGIASLAAIVAVLQVIANYIAFGPVSITLALIPLIIGAILYGPLGGGFLGALMGLIILSAPSTGSFLAVNPWITALICILKTTIAGVVSGLLFKGFYKLNFVLAVVLASLSAPVVNTGLFALGCSTLMYPTLVEWAGGSNAIEFLFLTMIGWNFLIEFAINSLLSPMVVYLVRVVATRYHLGSSFNPGVLKENEGK